MDRQPEFGVAGETIKQPMKAMYTGELIFGAKGDSLVLNPFETDQIAVWKVESEKTPFALAVVVSDIAPFSGGFSVAVPESRSTAGAQRDDLQCPPTRGRLESGR